MRILLALAAFPLLSTFAPIGLFGIPAPPAAARYWAERVPLDADDPARRRLGALTYLDGWRLSSDDRRFGGISAMHVEAGAVTAISDAGAVFRFALPRGQGPQPVSVMPLADGPGDPRSKRQRDSEALLVHGASAWVVFERSNSVWRYDRATWRREASHAPPAMRSWSANSGGEAIVRLSDGRFLILCEGRRRSGGATDALLFDGDPSEPDAKPLRLSYRAPSGYRITDAALLPDGRILFLNRRVSRGDGLLALLPGGGNPFFSRRFSIADALHAKLTLARLPKLVEGAVLSGEEIADFALPTTTDNMEALSVTVEDGRTIVWIASDDNFIPLQQTLLLKFALE